MAGGNAVELVGSRKHVSASQVDTAGGIGTRLTAASTPYLQATVQAVKKGAAEVPPTANTGLVHIHVGAGGNAFSLSPGNSVQLPDFGDLYNVYLIAATSGDGVTIMYTQEM